MHDMAHPFIAPDLICAAADGIALIASRERSSGRISFPARAEGDPGWERIVLPREGRLWSWTVQRFRPKSPPYAGPDAFEPYAVGYVELDGAIIVEGRLTNVSFDALTIGLPMRVVPLAFRRADGTVCTTFAFAPANGAAA